MKKTYGIYIYICNSETEGKAHSFNTYIELFCISIL